MSLKRKRSDPSLSPAATTTSASSATTPPRDSPTTVHSYFPQTKPIDPWFAQSKHATSHLGSRTMKRHRDNRPDEAQIHAQTIAKLFSAQRQPHVSPPATPTDEGLDLFGQEMDVDMDLDLNSVDHERYTLPQNEQLPAPESGQKSTLHSFWSSRQGADGR